MRYSVDWDIFSIPIVMTKLMVFDLSINLKSKIFENLRISKTDRIDLLG